MQMARNKTLNLSRHIGDVYHHVILWPRAGICGLKNGDIVHSLFSECGLVLLEETCYTEAMCRAKKRLSLRCGGVELHPGPRLEPSRWSHARSLVDDILGAGVVDYMLSEEILYGVWIYIRCAACVRPDEICDIRPPR